MAAGTAGLGLGAARALVAEGVSVAVCGRDRTRLDDAIGDLRVRAAGGAQVLGFEADLSSPEAASAFVLDASAALDAPVDILVANAGGPPAGTFTTTDLDDYRAAVELNFLSTVAMCRAAVPPMRERGWGRVVAVTSVGARQPITDLFASSAARAAVTSFLKNLATEVAADGVTVNSLQPGLHRTARVEHLGGEHAERMAAGVPAGRFGDPDDFGAVAAFLCSEQAAFVTGTGLAVDGGSSRSLL